MKKALVLCCLGLLLSAGLAVPELAAANKATVYLVHGLPGQDIGEMTSLPVDVYFNDVAKATSFTLGKVAKPFTLDPGSYSVKVYETPTAKPPAATPFITATVVLGDGENATVILHLSALKKAVLSKFTNDFTKVANGCARFAVHHTASGIALSPCFFHPAVEYGHPYFVVDNMENGNKAVFEISPKLAGNYSFEVFESKPDPSRFFKKSFPVQANKATLIYIIGTRGTSSFSVVSITKAVK